MSAWCYSPAFLGHFPIFRNIQTNFAAPKSDLKWRFLGIVLSNNLHLKQIHEPAWHVNNGCGVTVYNTGTCSLQYALHITYGLQCIKIFSDEKVESPVRWLLLYGVADLCTVGSWCPLFSSNSNTREVAQLDATIGAVCREPSSNQLLEYVGEFLLRTLSGNEVESSKRCLISGCTVLDL